jgi:hypothetical protein
MWQGEAATQARRSPVANVGYTYISIQWNKAVTEIFGPAAPNDGQPHNRLVYGAIDRSADAWEIAAALSMPFYD